jgi:hypothetical protein
MRRLVLVFILFSMARLTYGQTALPSILSSAASNSVFAQNGNLIVFDVSYSYPTAVNQSTAIRFPPVVKTNVTVIPITNGVAGKPSSSAYDGALQIVGVGGRAVYASVSTYTPTMLPLPAPGQIPTSIVNAGNAGAGAIIVPTPIVPIPFTLNRRLVALNAVAGILPSTLPSIDALGGADVKISVGAGNGAPDTIALIDSGFLPPIVTGTTSSTSSSTSHSVRLFTFNGGSFIPINQTPISVP